MGAINFNKPSEGVVDDTNTTAFNVRAKGDGTIPIRGVTEHNKWTDAVVGDSKNWVGVHGISNTNHSALWGEAKGEGGIGVWAETTHDKGGAGVVGVSKNWVGVHGMGKGNAAGVYGESTAADGVKGVSTNAAGVAGSSTNSFGIWGHSETTYGVYGHSNGFDGIKGETDGALAAGVAGFNKTNKGYGIWGSGGEWAGAFQGNVLVTGDITLSNADCAEEFDVLEENVDAGTVMVLTGTGSLQPSYQEYDKKVAGVVSGASGYKPAIVLDRKQSQNQDLEPSLRLPVALMGKTYCKVDARCSSIEIGDLLTTSSTKGYAMKAEDPVKAFGAVIGKALGSIKEGLGMIPVLVTLQ
jgi:hypothetical protein